MKRLRLRLHLPQPDLASQTIAELVLGAVCIAALLRWMM
jgi:hypothetical protein